MNSELTEFIFVYTLYCYHPIHGHSPKADTHFTISQTTEDLR